MESSEIQRRAEQQPTIVDRVCERAASRSRELAFLFEHEGEAPLELTYAQLDSQARKIGVWLQKRGLKGERILIAEPHSLEYIAAILGCIYGGSIAVPVLSPKLNRHLQRLRSIIKDATPKVAFTSSSVLSRVGMLRREVPELNTVQWATIDEADDEDPQSWSRSAMDEQQVALLQYTSGSTGNPRGVMVSHGNLKANLNMIQEAFRIREQSVIAGWLPLYHDMGLVGTILAPLWSGAKCVLMSTTAFVENPLRWLKLITKYRANISGGPNFAYELCVQRISEGDRRLDLSSWEIAFTGSEPVRAGTLQQFAEMFSSCGFRETSWFPCYGLAEATLFVSGSARNDLPPVEHMVANKTEHVDGRAFEGQTRGSSIVSCGRAHVDQDVFIVDPGTRVICAPRCEGELWISGPNVSRGYWNQEDATNAVFGAFLQDTRGPFLRTGDLGFVNDKQDLFITGRLKDLIIVRGRNHHPEDLEYSVRNAHPAFRGRSSAAFSIEVNGKTEVVVLQEISARSKNYELSELLESVNKSLGEEHEVKPYLVGLVKSGGLPKTTSGKIRRRECKRDLLNGHLEVMATNRPDFLSRAGSIKTDPLIDISQDDRSMLEEVRLTVAKILGTSPSEVQSNKPLMALGMDSVQTGDLKAKIVQRWGVDLPWEILLDAPTVAQLTASIVAKRGETSPETRDPIPVVANSQFPLSMGQRAQWFVYKLAPVNAAYNIPIGIRVAGEIDLVKFKTAFQDVIARHASLRTQFSSGPDGPSQTVLPHVEAPLKIVPAEMWTESELATHMRESVSRPFALEQAPLFRIIVYVRHRLEHIVLFVIHHIVTDFNSLVLLLHELLSAYSSLKEAVPQQLPPLEHQYIDFVYWQQGMLASEKGEALRRFWQEELRGELPILRLPIDRPRPRIQTYAGSTYQLNFNGNLCRKVLALSAAHRSTAYSLLTAAFMTLLHRYTSQLDIVIGSPSSGRTQTRWRNVTGYFLNPVVLRTSFVPHERFSDVWHKVTHSIKNAVANQDYPLALFGDQIHPERNPAYPPFFQTMFTFNRVSSEYPKEIAALAVGSSGFSVDWDGLSLKSIPIGQQLIQLDLTFAISQIGDQFLGCIQYNTDLFDESTIARMAGHLSVLLESIVDGVNLPLSDLRLLTQQEEEQLLYSWNRTDAEYDHAAFVQHQFDAQVQKLADRTAIISYNQNLTYRQLQTRSNQVAHYLISRGARPDMPIGLCIERSAEMMVGLLGILKSGASYLPIDPSLPDERIEYVVRDSQTRIILSEKSLRNRLCHCCPEIVCIDEDSLIKNQDTGTPISSIDPNNLAYVMYTSASTGEPKGVMISHCSVVNFMESMDRVIGCGPEDTMLAMTSMSFDISVLELLWTLARGARVVLTDPAGRSQRSVESAPKANDIDYSLFYFASTDDQNCSGNDKYRLLLEGARFADRNGLVAVWTPERHFHRFGGLYPNPAVTSAALAATTRRVQLRAGSVVLPLHNILRIAEEWSVVDNISGGRTGIAFASGWHADDFVLAPQNYFDRKEITFQSIQTFLKLWEGEPIKVQSGSGKEIEVRTFPKPIQRKPPVWITAAGSADTFVRAGQLGTNVLTHLLGQTVEDLGANIGLYRNSLKEAGHSQETGRVTLMLHTFVGEELGSVKDIVRKPFVEYLRSSVDLIKKFVVSANLPIDLENLTPRDMNELLNHAFDRYFGTSALFGTVSSCGAMVERLKNVGVNEIACLVDFGVDNDLAFSALSGIAALGEQSCLQASLRHQPQPVRKSVKQLAEQYSPTLMQCTPTMLQALEASTDSYQAFRSLRVLMLGGEPLPHALAQRVKSNLPCRLVNMYGPTETTIWSSTEEIGKKDGAISIGQPIRNTQFYILDELYSHPVPIGVTGELHIGGDGLARGYLGRPELTAEKFIPDDFSGRSGARVYRTGDLARFLNDGRVDLLGRSDTQVKIRGIRIELDEIESALVQHPQIKEAAVSAQGDPKTAKELVAYIVVVTSPPPTVGTIRQFLKSKFPDAMVPSRYVFLKTLPVNANGKLDRQALSFLDRGEPQSIAPKGAPVNEHELLVAGIWKEVLGRECVSADDNFFDVGGHSLRMIQVQGRLSKQLGKEVPLMDLFENPTIRSLARHLSEQEGSTPTQRDEDTRALRQEKALLHQGKASKVARRSMR